MPNSFEPGTEEVSFKISGPVTQAIIEEWECCRIWPIVTKTLTWSEENESWRTESWWVRPCGLCGEYPRPMS